MDSTRVYVPHFPLSWHTAHTYKFLARESRLLGRRRRERSRSEWLLSMPLGGASHGEGGQSLVHGELDALLRHVLSDLSGVQHEGHVKHLAL